MLVSEPLQSLLVPDYSVLEERLFSHVAAPVSVGGSILLALVWYVVMQTRRLMLSILTSALPPVLVVVLVSFGAPASEEGPQFALLITPLTAFALALFWVTCRSLERIRLSC